MTSSRSRRSSAFELWIAFAAACLFTWAAPSSVEAQKKRPAATAKKKARKKKPPPEPEAPAAEDIAVTWDEPLPSEPRAPVDDGRDKSETIDLEGTGDVSETIDLEGASAPAPAAEQEALSVGDELSFRLRGFGRVRASGALRGDDGDGIGVQVPFEPFLGDTQLFLELRVQKDRRYEALVSGLLGYTLAAHREESATLRETKPRGLLEPSLREAYVGMMLARVSMRLGQQRLAWGNSDAFPINDAINPRDLRDPLIAETELLRLPTVAARLDLNFDDLSFTLAVMPFFVPDRLDTYGTNYAFVGPRAPAGIRGAFGTLSNAVDPSLREPNQVLLRQTELPKDDGSATAVGARMNASLGGIDLTPSYHYGYTTQPDLRVDPAFAQFIATTDWTQPSAEAVGALLGARGTGLLTATYRRRHHAGLSLATTVGSFVVRGEAAYDSAQVFYQPSLLSIVRPTVQGVVGFEYQPGEVGKAIILEATALRLLSDPPPVLLGAAQTTYGAAAILRWTFFEHLECELRAVGAMQPNGLMLRPQVAYKQGAYELRAGVVVLDGAENSKERYLLRNTSAYLVGKAQF